VTNALCRPNRPSLREESLGTIDSFDKSSIRSPSANERALPDSYVFTQPRFTTVCYLYRFDFPGLRSKLPQRFPRPLQAIESRRCWPHRVEQDIVQRQRSRHALRDAPGARRIVLLVNSFQPLFVFAFGIVLTLFFPRVAKESIGRMKMLQKGVGICLMLVGGYLISR
jgi:hypothetical protein